MACECHDRAVARTRISTTVDQDLLENARNTGAGSYDSELIDAVLAAPCTTTIRGLPNESGSQWRAYAGYVCGICRCDRLRLIDSESEPCW